MVGLVRVFLRLRHLLARARDLRMREQRRSEALARFSANAESQRLANVRTTSTRKLLAAVAMDLHASDKVGCLVRTVLDFSGSCLVSHLRCNCQRLG